MLIQVLYTLQYGHKAFSGTTQINIGQTKSVLLIICRYLGINRRLVQKLFFIKGVLKNFAKFTGKHLCQSLSFNKIAGLRPQIRLMQIY